MYRHMIIRLLDKNFEIVLLETHYKSEIVQFLLQIVGCLAGTFVLFHVPLLMDTS